MKVRYKGTSDQRIIYAKDWKSVGIDHEMVVWAGPGSEADVSEEAGAWLVENDPEFEAVSKSGTTSSSSAPSAAPEKDQAKTTKS